MTTRDVQSAYYDAMEDGFYPEFLAINRQDFADLIEAQGKNHAYLPTSGSIPHYTIYGCQIIILDVPVPIFTRSV